MGQPPSVFVHRSELPASASAVFRWHEHPDAARHLLPRMFIRLEHHDGSLGNGTVVLSVGLGPVRLRWETRHCGYVRDSQFCDEQVRGPFAVWKHIHRVEPLGPNRCVYEDRVEYAVRGGRLVRALVERPLGWMFARAFARRHAIVRAQVTGQT